MVVSRFGSRVSRFAFCLVAALLLSQLSFSLSCPENATSYILGFQETQNLIPLVLMFTVLVIVAAYVAGTAFNQQNLIIFYKDEMFHLLISVLLLLGFTGILYTSCEVSKGFLDFSFSTIGINSPCYQTNADMLSVSTCYLGMMESKGKSMVESYVSDSIYNLMDSTFAYSLYFPFFGGVTVATNAFKRTYSMQFDSLNNIYVMPALVSISMQLQILKFIQNFGMQLIFPLGFLMRVFTPTRQMGNAIIAFGIGLYTLLPLMYVLGASMYDVALGSCSKYSGIIDDAVLGGCGSNNNFFDVARLIPQAFFLPNLAMAVFISFVMALNKAFRVIG